MRAAYASSSYVNRPTLGSRATSFVIALAFVALLIWMLLRLGLLPDTINQPSRPLSVVDIRGDRSSGAKAAKAIKVAQAKKSTVTKTPKPTAAVPTPKVPPPPIPWNVIPMSHDDFAASDISTKPNRAAERSAQGGDAGAGSGSGAGDDSGSGGGPNGDRLYNAQWYPHPPTQAEMDFYLPKNGMRMSGWGEIACRTVANYRVEDCKELGDSPGSGFARSMVNAAWQFRVLPPRVNGKPMVGTWVRIHYDFYVKEAP